MHISYGLVFGPMASRIRRLATLNESYLIVSQGSYLKKKLNLFLEVVI